MTTLTLIDTELEKEIEIGRDYPYEAIPEGECLIAEETALSHGLTEGDEFHLRITMQNALVQLSAYYEAISGTTIQTGSFSLTFPCRIRTVFSKLYGKVPTSAESNLVLMEID